ncbi:MAG: metal ABC transporter ATP-binding protein [Candidatus Saccharimonadia bacterium]
MTKHSQNLTIELESATLSLGRRELWHQLDLTVSSGEFIAVLGPNGSGKTSLLKILLGLLPLTAGKVLVNGAVPGKGSSRVGYIPQQKAFDPDLPIRGRDLVHFGLDGHLYGIGLHALNGDKLVNDVIAKVGAKDYADRPIGQLSGGEQQRLRIAQALLGDPTVLLCDEPLLSLDLASQQAICELIDNRRQESGTSIVFVTHEINPILPYVDRVLYLVGPKWAIGKPDEVMNAKVLSELYATQVEVIRVGGRIFIVGSEASPHTIAESGAHAHEVLG